MNHGKKLRLLFLNHNVAWGGGTFYRAYHTARYLVLRGHSVTLMTISPKSRWGFEFDSSGGVEIVQTPDLMWGIGRSGWDPWNTINRLVFLSGKQWDVIHAWDCRPAVIFPALYARRQSVIGKLVIDWCDWWGRGGTQAERPGKFAKLIYGPLETFFEEAFRTKADGTTIASKPLMERARRMGVRSDFFMLPGGCDTQTISPLEINEAREQLGLPKQDWLVGCIGALTLQEARMLVQSCILAQRQVPNLRLLLIGVKIAGSHIPLQDAIGNLWGDWIIESGRIPFSEVGVHLSACNALLLPLEKNISNMARWPSKINDYLASGRPIISTRVGEIEPLFHQEIGLTTEANPNSFADAIVEIAQGREKAEYYGRQARTMAEGELNWEIIVGNLEDFYKKLVGNNKI